MNWRRKKFFQVSPFLSEKNFEAFCDAFSVVQSQRVLPLQKRERTAFPKANAAFLSELFQSDLFGHFFFKYEKNANDCKDDHSLKVSSFFIRIHLMFIHRVTDAGTCLAFFFFCIRVENYLRET